MRTTYRVISIVTGVFWAICAQCGIEILSELRFPTEDYKKYPLASICEYLNGKISGRIIRRVVPYKELEFVQPIREKYEEFKIIKFPFSEAQSDEIKYSDGIGMDGVIPYCGVRNIGAEKIGEIYLYKFIFSNGRLKNVYSISKGINPIPKLEYCVQYDDEKRLITSCTFSNDAVNEINIGEYSSQEELSNPKSYPVRIFHFFNGRLNHYETYEAGKITMNVNVPFPVETGKFPSQARRYHIAIDEIIADKSLPENVKVTYLLKFLELEPEKNEDERRGEESYSSIHCHVISSLGDLRCKTSFDGLVNLLGGKYCAMVAGALAKHANHEALPFLVSALEREDLKVKTEGLKRNEHIRTHAIVGAMIEISPGSAEKLLDKFLKSGDRYFRSQIIKTQEQKLENKD